MNAPMNGLERALVKATQGGLAPVPAPYEHIARELGVSQEEVLAGLRRMLADGRIRRIGAVPNHYALGYTANAMSVWDVADEAVHELGLRVGALAFVTHCYRRPRRLPDWPYNLFAMVHGRSRADTGHKIAIIRAALGDSLRAADVLYSTRILKKTGLRIA
jgi:DNA-binding Lrp family transcriptional regulator